MSNDSLSHKNKRDSVRLALFKNLPRLRSVMELPFRTPEGRAPIVVALGSDTVEETFAEASVTGGANVFVFSGDGDDAELDLVIFDLVEATARKSEPVAKVASMAMLVSRLKQNPDERVRMQLTPQGFDARARESQKLNKNLALA